MAYTSWAHRHEIGLLDQRRFKLQTQAHFLLKLRDAPSAFCDSDQEYDK